MTDWEGAAEIVKSGAVEKLVDLIHNLAGPMTEEIGLGLGERVRAFRLKNMISVVQKSRKMLADAGLPENAVPPRMFLPLIDTSSLETDETLQDMWPGLLASASDKSDNLSPSFHRDVETADPT